MTSALLEAFTALADATRCRLLLLLEKHELTVSEICVVQQLPQSTVSRHLKMLVDVGLLTSRRDGTSRYYSLAPSGDGGGNLQTTGELWQVARRTLADSPGVDQDRRRLDRVLSQRREKSRQFFASAAGEWDRLRDELFGAGFYGRALLGLLPSTWAVGDLGCGTGAIIGELAPHVARVIGIDGSDEMLEAARARVAGFQNVELQRGALESLPLEDQQLDAATLILVLHHLPAPADALAEAHRVLKPGGRLLIVDMTPHEREEYRHLMGHVWLGFSEEQMTRLLEQAGFTGVRVLALTPTSEMKGPALFVASGTRRS